MVVDILWVGLGSVLVVLARSEVGRCGRGFCGVLYDYYVGYKSAGMEKLCVGGEDLYFWVV